MATPAQILKKCLIDQSLVSMLQPSVWPAYITSMPDTPQAPIDCVGLFDRGALLDGRIHQTGEVVEHPEIHILIRSNRYELGYAKALAIRGAIDAIRRTPVTTPGGSYRIEACTRTQALLSLGADPTTTKRSEWFSLNVRMTVTALSGSDFSIEFSNEFQ